jgi:hypothetical protein
MVINKMQKTKIVIALVAVAALTLVAVGLASAQIAANQTYTGTNPNNGLLGWIGNCFGYGTNQAYGSQYVAPQPPTDSSVPAPYQGGYGNGYGYGYGYGPCWAR